MPHDEEFVLIIKSYETFENFVKLIRGDNENKLKELADKLRESSEPLKKAVETHS